MPWQTVTPMEEIIRFVTLAQTDRFTMTDLCEQFGISRKTGYKHLERYAAGGLKALAARSHRPHECPHRNTALPRRLCAAMVSSTPLTLTVLQLPKLHLRQILEPSRSQREPLQIGRSSQ